jgi:hypothetical protein
MLNWFGLEAHRSDSLIHWTEIEFQNNGNQLTPTIKKHIEAVRAAWDLIHNTEEMSAAFNLLYDCARSVARADYASGEDL